MEKFPRQEKVDIKCPVLKKCKDFKIAKLKLTAVLRTPSGLICKYDETSSCNFAPSTFDKKTPVHRFCSLNGNYFQQEQIVIEPNGQAVVIGC